MEKTFVITWTYNKEKKEKADNKSVNCADVSLKRQNGVCVECKQT